MYDWPFSGRQALNGQESYEYLYFSKSDPFLFQIYIPGISSNVLCVPNYGCNKTYLVTPLVIPCFYSLLSKSTVLGKFGSKIKIMILRRNLVPILIRVFSIHPCSLFLFSTGNTLYGQFVLKNQHRQSKLKFGT